MAYDIQYYVRKFIFDIIFFSKNFSQNIPLTNDYHIHSLIEFDLDKFIILVSLAVHT